MTQRDCIVVRSKTSTKPEAVTSFEDVDDPTPAVGVSRTTATGKARRTWGVVAVDENVEEEEEDDVG